MRIERLRPAAVALVLLFAILLSACSAVSEGKTEREGSGADSEAGRSDPAMVTAHFPTFEVSVPSGWTVRGNVGKVCEGENAFLLVGPVTEASVEECIAAELELFFNTEYYRSQVAFRYDSYEETPGGIRVRGGLTNGRTGDLMRFAGGYFKEPDAYVLYLWNEGDAPAEVMDLAEASYESFHAL